VKAKFLLAPNPSASRTATIRSDASVELFIRVRKERIACNCKEEEDCDVESRAGTPRTDHQLLADL
jgi:hypothetical protein